LSLQGYFEASTRAPGQALRMNNAQGGALVDPSLRSGFHNLTMRFVISIGADFVDITPFPRLTRLE